MYCYSLRQMGNYKSLIGSSFTLLPHDLELLHSNLSSSKKVDLLTPILSVSDYYNEIWFPIPPRSLTHPLPNRIILQLLFDSSAFIIFNHSGKLLDCLLISKRCTLCPYKKEQTRGSIKQFQVNHSQGSKFHPIARIRTHQTGNGHRA